MKIRHSLRYAFFGMIGNSALKLYMSAPREGLQQELLKIHRWALRKAHTARLKGEMEQHAEN